MNRHRLVAAIFFSVVIVAVLSVIVGAEVVSSGQTVTVLRMRAGVQQGALFSPADVEQVPLRMAPGDLNYEVPGSVQPGSRFTVSLQSGDLLEPHDLISGGAQIAITLTVADPPPLQSGEAVDLFANLPNTGTEVLIGHDLTVEQVDGDAVTVLVGSQEELAWLEIMTYSGSSGLRLYALAAVGSVPSGLAPDDAGQAICELAPESCSVLAVPTPAEQPLASPSPSSTPVP